MILKRFLITVSVLLMLTVTFAQNSITGIWEGQFLTAQTDLGVPKLVVEIYNFKDSLFTGITHLYYAGNKYEHYKMIGWYDKKDSLLVYTEASTIAVDLGIYGNCLGTYKMILRKDGTNLFQYGYWEANIKGCTTASQIWLRKKVQEITKAPAEKKKTPEVKKPVMAKKITIEKPLKGRINTPVIAPTPTAPVVKNTLSIKTGPSIMPVKIAQRETDVQSLLEIAPEEKDSIKVDVYDNGDIDGDSVSVYHDNVLLINKRMITAKAITFYVSLNKKDNPISHLRLVAESLGSIPPCTALMIVTTKSKRYEVRLSSNFNKNASVELFLKE